MSQLNPNYCVLIERNDTFPTKKEGMGLEDIKSYLFKKHIRKSYKEISEKYPEINSANFKNAIKEDCTLINEEADMFFAANHFYSGYKDIISQTLIPTKICTGTPDEFNVIEYIYLNTYVNGCNHFIIALIIDLNYIKSDFYSKFKYYFPAEIVAKNHERFYPDSFHKQLLSLYNPGCDKIKIKTEFTNNNNFIKLLLSYALFHFDNIKLNANIKLNIEFAAETKSIIKAPLFRSQLQDIAWMEDIETDSITNKKPIILDNIKSIPFGNHYEINFTESEIAGLPDYSFAPKRTIENTDPDKLNYLIGGCLSSDPGCGKTLSILAHCSSPKNKDNLSLICAPEHLVHHWVAEHKKFIGADFAIYIYEFPHIINGYNNEIMLSVPTCGIIVASFQNAEHAHFRTERIVIDECQTIFASFENIALSETISLAKWHWCITTTPFITDELYKNIINYCTLKRYTRYYGITDSMFKTTKQKHNIITNFHRIKLSSRESAKLASLVSEEDQRKFCLFPTLYLNNSIPFSYCFSESEFIDVILKEHSLDELQEGINELQIQARIHIKFVKMQLKRIADCGYISMKTNKKIKHESKHEHDHKSASTSTSIKPPDITCSICYDKLNPDFTMLRCAHVFCSDCIKKLLDHGHTECSMCKMKLINTKCFRNIETMTDKKLVELYGTKIAFIIDFCNKNLHEKIVIYIDDKKHASILYNFLYNGGINAILYKKPDDIFVFSKPELQSQAQAQSHAHTHMHAHMHMQVIILSSQNNASGLFISGTTILMLLQRISSKHNLKNIIARCASPYQIQKTPLKMMCISIEDSIEDTKHELL